MSKSGDLDVVIAGGGPGGLSALQWCVDLGLSAVLLEREGKLGGQLLRIYNPISNYPGVNAADGRELCNLFLQQLSERDGLIRTEGEIVAADLSRKAVATSDGTSYSARAIIIATGVRRRELGIPGERKFRGLGVMNSGVREQKEVAGKNVVIVGGGDAALENALLLADQAAKVFVVHRRDVFAARQDFLARASKNATIECIMNAVLISIDGGDSVETVTLKDVRSGKLSTLPADRVLIRIGVQPNTELFRGQIVLDDAGYIVIDRDCATDLPGVYAVGDVANPRAPTIAAAVGQGSIAVKTVSGQLRRRKLSR